MRFVKGCLVGFIAAAGAVLFMAAGFLSSLEGATHGIPPARFFSSGITLRIALAAFVAGFLSEAGHWLLGEHHIRADWPRLSTPAGK